MSFVTCYYLLHYCVWQVPIVTFRQIRYSITHQPVRTSGAVAAVNDKRYLSDKMWTLYYVSQLHIVYRIFATAYEGLLPSGNK
jgi:hypothetical protein